MKTVFLRALETDLDKREAGLKAAIHAPDAAKKRTRFEVDPAGFAAVPKSPFAYWLAAPVTVLFRTIPCLEEGKGGRIARRGVGTNDDFRFLRLWTESDPTESGWFPLAKGGPFARFYGHLDLAINWHNDGHQLKAFFITKGESPSRNIRSESQYFRPGLTWSLRTTSDLSLRMMPANCIFGSKGPAILVDEDSGPALLTLAAITNSAPFCALVALQLAAADAAARSYEVGVLQLTPVPDPTPNPATVLATLAHRAWSLRRQLDTITEISHTLTLPALLQAEGVSLLARGDAWSAHVTDILAEFDRIQAEIDNRCFALYGISDEDRSSIERGFGTEPDASAEADSEKPSPIDPAPFVEQLLSWTLGATFGRFDIRLATGGRAMPTEPKPFDPLPTCSPGMLTGGNGLPPDAPPENYPIAIPEDGILGDDPGHSGDLNAAVRAVFDIVFADGDAHWHEAAELVGARKFDLRLWFARDFFPLHVKTYSKSRRKAPIYWQLATPSASYSVWVYYHRFTPDTLFRVYELADLKLQHEESKLNALIRDAGTEPSRDQRGEISTQETFVTELRAFKAEVDRVVPLWNPDLNDGVILNFAPLWRLVPQHKPWQQEVKKIWEKLVAGDYDWAHLAMHLWPERVVPKCQDDRSLAIAHELENDFWVEDDAGKWQKCQVAVEKVRALIAERSSSAVKTALDDLLSAPVPSGGTGRRKSAHRKKHTRPRPSRAPRASAGDTPGEKNA